MLCTSNYNHAVTGKEWWRLPVPGSKIKEFLHFVIMHQSSVHSFLTVEPPSERPNTTSAPAMEDPTKSQQSSKHCLLPIYMLYNMYIFFIVETASTKPANPKRKHCFS